jgi:hypothetical protein
MFPSVLFEGMQYSLPGSAGGLTLHENSFAAPSWVTTRWLMARKPQALAGRLLDVAASGWSRD